MQRYSFVLSQLRRPVPLIGKAGGRMGPRALRDIDGLTDRWRRIVDVRRQGAGRRPGIDERRARHLMTTASAGRDRRCRSSESAKWRTYRLLLILHQSIATESPLVTMRPNYGSPRLTVRTRDSRHPAVVGQWSRSTVCWFISMRVPTEPLHECVDRAERRSRCVERQPIRCVCRDARSRFRPLVDAGLDPRT